MSLIESMMEKFVIMNEIKAPDGDGGSITQWLDGMEFEAAITLDTTMEARIAEKQGVTSVYNVITKRNMNLKYHDVIKRVSDKKVFRVTSDGEDVKSPALSTLDISKVTAEKWELTQ